MAWHVCTGSMLPLFVLFPVTVVLLEANQQAHTGKMQSSIRSTKGWGCVSIFVWSTQP